MGAGDQTERSASRVPCADDVRAHLSGTRRRRLITRVPRLARSSALPAPSRGCTRGLGDNRVAGVTFTTTRLST